MLPALAVTTVWIALVLIVLIFIVITAWIGRIKTGGGPKPGNLTNLVLLILTLIVFAFLIWWLIAALTENPAEWESSLNTKLVANTSSIGNRKLFEMYFPTPLGGTPIKPLTIDRRNISTPEKRDKVRAEFAEHISRVTARLDAMNYYLVAVAAMDYIVPGTKLNNPENATVKRILTNCQIALAQMKFVGSIPSDEDFYLQPLANVAADSSFNAFTDYITELRGKAIYSNSNIKYMQLRLILKYMIEVYSKPDLLISPGNKRGYTALLVSKFGLQPRSKKEKEACFNAMKEVDRELSGGQKHALDIIMKSILNRPSIPNVFDWDPQFRTQPVGFQSRLLRLISMYSVEGDSYELRTKEYIDRAEIEANRNLVNQVLLLREEGDLIEGDKLMSNEFIGFFECHLNEFILHNNILNILTGPENDVVNEALFAEALRIFDSNPKCRKSDTFTQNGPIKTLIESRNVKLLMNARKSPELMSPIESLAKDTVLALFNTLTRLIRILPETPNMDLYRVKATDAIRGINITPVFERGLGVALNIEASDVKSTILEGMKRADPDLKITELNTISVTEWIRKLKHEKDVSHSLSGRI